ncbi:MAG: sigma-70 family RNA polymerase sigma factor [Planctomycetes bacterium]|jgi:RNA polymerase sigma-70 factor (ECF subfamily)|nr:sigma-70 family RNA polymerase sigma factor [Planctomycetota bacterium]
MAGPDSTSWTLIQGAAKGDTASREEFARRYEPVVRAFLAARWRGGRLLEEIDDAVQEAMLLCLSPDSPLEHFDRERPGGFRAYLWGVVRNIARSFERELKKRGFRVPANLEEIPEDDSSLATVFDRAWARSLLSQAAALQRERARAAGGGAADRRIELLQLRLEDELPIREIAARWNEDPDRLHREYARAREDFKHCLFTVVREHHPGGDAEVEKECLRLVSIFA